jgi:hypothetical protein
VDKLIVGAEEDALLFSETEAGLRQQQAVMERLVTVLADVKEVCRRVE